MSSSFSSVFPSAAAVLSTERLLLRPWPTAEITAVLAGARLTHWAHDFPAEGDHVIAGYLDEHPQALSTHGQRQIVERSSGQVVGSIGLFWPPVDGAVEFGYGVVASRRGRGYATEAARAVVAFALTAPGVHTVRAEVELSNPASVRVLEKTGLRRRGGDASTARYATSGPDRRQE
ncbi:GNAT family N-acetyltransferase [Streptomyces bullii]|uniref:GNAT family N-acetyltransferase n=1 Tax=Streptomyces bullii TaxID=349910 RepID=A0ABW0UP38_9ACTN